MGVYVLLRNAKPAYVGRSDSDLQQEIRKSASLGDYKRFYFDYASSPMNAYKQECELYHGFQPPDNQNHPAVPAYQDWHCPVKGCEWS
jgi:hypothetical protein